MLYFRIELTTFVEDKILWFTIHIDVWCHSPVTPYFHFKCKGIFQAKRNAQATNSKQMTKNIYMILNGQIFFLYKENM